MRKSVVGMLLTFGVSSMALHAQTEVLSSGGNATGTGGSSSYSVGQIVYTYASDVLGSSSPGVQQPFEFFTVGIEENPDVCLSMSVYPNPAQSRVELNIESMSVENLSFRLFTISGEVLFTEKITEHRTPIALETMVSGMYIVQVINNDRPIQTFTIIKKN